MHDTTQAPNGQGAYFWAYWLLAISAFSAALFTLGDVLGGNTARAVGFFLAALALYPNARSTGIRYGKHVPFAPYALVWLGICAAISCLERVLPSN